MNSTHRTIIRNAAAWTLVVAIGVAFWVLVAMTVWHWL